MTPCRAFDYGYWWIFPIIMLAMIVLCFFIMRGHAGSMMCGPGFGRSGGHRGSATDRPPDILNRKYDQGEINTQEHKEKKKDITGGT